MPRWTAAVLASLLALANGGCSDDAVTPVDPGAGGGGEGGGLPDPPAVGPQATSCAAGELELADGSCLAAGVETCGAGFDSDGDGGCVPILPAAACTPPLMAQLGETSCRDIAPCGAPPWGNIPVDSTAQYVDVSYGGNDSDGTAGSPWLTIQDAVAAAADGAVIAIAAGSYSGTVSANGKAVKIWGVCPSQVELTAASGSDVVQFISADGGELHQVAVTGGRFGVSVWDAQNVVVDSVWVHHTGEEGIYVYNFGGLASATVRSSLIHDAVSQGVDVEGGDVTVEDSIVADTQADAMGEFGRGLEVDADGDQMLRGRLVIRRSIVERNHDQNILGWGSDILVEDSLVRDGRPKVADQAGGSGIETRTDPASGFYPSVEVSGSVVADNVSCGICPHDADAAIDNTVVRGTAVRPTDGLNGMGVIALPLDRDPDVSLPLLSVSRSLIADNTFLGIGVSGVRAEIEATIVRDTNNQEATIAGGRGIDFETNIGFGRRAEGSVRGVVVERSVSSGIVAVGSDLRVESAHVSGTVPLPGGLSGRGISAETDPITDMLAAVEVYDSLIEHNSEYGAGAIGGTMHIENSIVRDTQPNGNAEAGWGILSQVEISEGADSHVDVVRCLVEGNREINVSVAGATMTVVDSIVRGALPQPSTDLFGDGIAVVRMERDESGILKYKPASIELSRTIVEGSARAGILNYASSITLGDMWMSCNPLDMDGELEFVFDDRGGNLCICDGVVSECKVLSTGLSAPSAL